MKTVYKTKGVCSRSIAIDMENGVINSVEFMGGCDGNLKAVSRLVKGMRARDAISALRGIRCGFKDTSCPDQLARALGELEKDAQESRAAGSPAVSKTENNT
jgi:uncharacterized protein (TIGR03905 family)